jgi:hypothetical protein
MEFWPLKSFFENSRMHRDSNSQSWTPFGSVRVHSHPLSCHSLSCIPGSIRSDSQAPFWPVTLQPLCLGREPKARVVTKKLLRTFSNSNPKKNARNLAQYNKAKKKPNDFLEAWKARNGTKKVQSLKALLVCAPCNSISGTGGEVGRHQGTMCCFFHPFLLPSFLTLALKFCFFFRLGFETHAQS